MCLHTLRRLPVPQKRSSSNPVSKRALLGRAEACNFVQSGDRSTAAGGWRLRGKYSMVSGSWAVHVTVHWVACQYEAEHRLTTCRSKLQQRHCTVQLCRRHVRGSVSLSASTATRVLWLCVYHELGSEIRFGIQVCAINTALRVSVVLLFQGQPTMIHMTARVCLSLPDSVNAYFA